jgi:hypothetical protein
MAGVVGSLWITPLATGASLKNRVIRIGGPLNWFDLKINVEEASE